MLVFITLAFISSFVCKPLQVSAFRGLQFFVFYIHATYTFSVSSLLYVFTFARTYVFTFAHTFLRSRARFTYVQLFGSSLSSRFPSSMGGVFVFSFVVPVSGVLQVVWMPAAGSSFCSWRQNLYLPFSREIRLWTTPHGDTSHGTV